jgi:Uma2 family endonuclease
MTTAKPIWGTMYIMPPTMTDDDLLGLSDDGAKNELYEGSVVQEEMTGPGHGDICHRLSVELGMYAKATGFPNRILQNSLFNFTPVGTTQKTILAPDVAITRSPTLPSRKQIPSVPPLLAIEVVSPSQTLVELGIKAQIYRNAGVDEVWLIDQDGRLVEIWTAQGVQTLTDGQTISTPLLPSFSLAVTYLLDG